jgi:hypothetical chaperone protein
MFAGLDYGTSNSSLGIIKNNKAQLLSLHNNEKSIPSTIYTYDRNYICDFVFNQLLNEQKEDYQITRQLNLQSAKSNKRHEGFEKNEQTVFFGKEAIEYYIDTPEEGVFIKSPKSFLGATGLSKAQTDFFEDLVSAMLFNIKTKGEQQLQQAISKVVIGRPVNYQGVNSDKSNQQAMNIMTSSAKRCGYKEVEFLYEPIAAGIDFETNLTEDKIVLVVDIGGGTTDCSMVKMGPSTIKKNDRTQDFLAHTGERVGGNDLDILLAYHELMPHLGRGSLQKKGIELPHGLFWTAVSINNVSEQSTFNSAQYSRSLVSLKRYAQHPKLLERLIHCQQSKLNHRLVRTAELAKIALTDEDNISLNLNYIDDELTHLINQHAFKQAVKKPLVSIQKLIKEAVKQSATKPDVIYITGGTAKSPAVQNAVEEVLPNVPILDGDYYGSVATGLTKWADKIWGL